MSKGLKKAGKIIGGIEDWMVIVLFTAMVVVTMAIVLCRYVFKVQFVPGEEIARYLMIWMAFIGAALVMQEDGHYKMTAVVDALPASIRGIVRGCAVLATVAFMLILAKVGVECCMKIAAMGQKSPTLKIPMWIAYASIPAGMILGVVQAVLRESIRLVSGKDEKGGEAK